MKTILKILLKVLITILSIILFIGICTYLALIISTKVITKDNVKELVKYSDINKILDADISSSFYKVADDNSVDRGIIDELVNSSDFKELIGEYSGSLVENVLYNSEIKKITSDEIVTITENNLDKSANAMGYTLSKEQKENILGEIDKVAKEFVEVISNQDNINNETLNNVKVLRTIFSTKTKMIVLIILLIITVLITISNWSIYKFAIWIGIPTMISGAIFISLGYAIGNMITITNYPIELTHFIASNISPIFMKSGIIVLVIGLIEIVYYKIMKTIKDNK